MNREAVLRHCNIDELAEITNNEIRIAKGEQPKVTERIEKLARYYLVHRRMIPVQLREAAARREQIPPEQLYDTALSSVCGAFLYYLPWEVELALKIYVYTKNRVDVNGKEFDPNSSPLVHHEFA